jgi:hypothetical protein
MKKLLIYSESFIYALVSLPIIFMVGNLFIHILKTDVSTFTGVIVWLACVCLYGFCSCLIVALLYQEHKERMSNLNQN